MSTDLSRRTVLQVFALTPLAAACGDDSDASPDAGNTGTDATPDQCERIPGETGGPFPGNGTNGANALALAGIVRSDIRTSVGPASATAPGIDLALTMKLTDTACMPLVGYAVYVWQADRDAEYSMYTGPATTENYLRGVQITDATGSVTFQTIFPACYPGRWPHVHFEVYASMAAATSGANRLAVSQLAFPEPICNEVYATTGYESSVTSLAGVTLASDGVFRDDGGEHQLATMSGTIGADLTATLTLALSV
jgi:protocatechuate 3,4-dioxygenase beta subunit